MASLAISRPTLPTARAALRADLASLGAEPEAAPAPFPPIASAAAALGCLYVTEGATLGGKILARKPSHLLDGVEGRHFLGGAQGLWREVCAAIEGCDDQPAMIEAANGTFAAFERHFAEGALPPRAPRPGT